MLEGSGPMVGRRGRADLFPGHRLPPVSLQPRDRRLRAALRPPLRAMVAAGSRRLIGRAMSNRVSGRSRSPAPRKIATHTWAHEHTLSLDITNGSRYY